MAELLGTIDVGTNTAHLLVSRITDVGEVVPIRSETRYVRLGQGVDASGEVHPDALARLRDTLRSFNDIARSAGATRITVVGTSASRDVRDRQALVDFVKTETGLDYTIISGEEEALLTTLGALSGVRDRTNPCVIVDIGGGSTELTLARYEGAAVTIVDTITVDIGSVRLTERFLRKLPPSDEDVAAARNLVDSLLSKATFAGEGYDRFVGAAGTIRALNLLTTSALSPRDRPDGDLHLSRGACREWYRRLQRLDYQQTLQLNERVLAGRADVFLAGVLILDSVFELLRADTCIVSPYGVRHGLAIRYASLKKGRDPGFQETFGGTP